MKGGDLDSKEASLIGGYQVNVGHCQLLQKTTVANSGVIPYVFFSYMWVGSVKGTDPSLISKPVRS